MENDDDAAGLTYQAPGEQTTAQTFREGRMFFSAVVIIVLGGALLLGALIGHKNPLFGIIAVVVGVLFFVYVWTIKKDRDNKKL